MHQVGWTSLSEISMTIFFIPHNQIMWHVLYICSFRKRRNFPVYEMIACLFVLCFGWPPIPKIETSICFCYAEKPKKLNSSDWSVHNFPTLSALLGLFFLCRILEWCNKPICIYISTYVYICVFTHTHTISTLSKNHVRYLVARRNFVKDHMYVSHGQTFWLFVCWGWGSVRIEDNHICFACDYIFFTLLNIERFYDRFFSFYIIDRNYF